MANQEGRTPAKTPETRTRLMHYQHPQIDGRVHYGDESWPIHAGVIECPMEIGEGADWPLATAEQIAAHAKALSAEVGGKSKDADDSPDVLKGSVSDVAEHLATITSVDEIAALETAERAGKDRKGVADAIAARLEALSAEGGGK